MNIGFRKLLLLLAVTTLCLFCLSLMLTSNFPGTNSGAPFLLLELLSDDADIARTIFIELRIPRATLALFVGASLGLAGAAMQGLLRNPLAEPGVVGVSGSAALGATLAFYTGFATIAPLALPLGGIAGALVAVLVLFSMAGKRADTTTLLLAGIAINAIAGALTALVLNLSPNPFAAMEIIFWQMGSLADRSLLHLQLAGPLMAVGWILILLAAPATRALSLGEVTAASLGTNVRNTQRQIIIGTALCVGAGVAVTGVIGFVGLVVPHLLRKLCANDPAKLLLASAGGGASLLLAADIAVRCIAVNAELKLGVITALLGAPFFLYLIFRLRALEQ
jgi:iron complex transport system permease protein